MHRRVALIASLAAAALAVAIVAVDLQYNVTATLQTQEDGEWQTIATQDADGFSGARYPSKLGGCAGPDMRIVIDNGILWRQNLDVRVVVYDFQVGREEVLVAETITVPSGEQAEIPFTVPEWALHNRTAQGDQFGGYANVDVTVDDTYFSTCVEAKA